MLNAKLILDKDFVISEVDPRLYGGFIEHLGRAIYEGFYEPDHPSADNDGFRTDVLELVRTLDMPVMRYPGGNFVSGYNWEDGVGPVENRPRRLDPAWFTTEPNTFGTNEFVTWCRKANTAPMMAVNLGTRGPDEARALVEYCNHPGGTAWSDLRRSHGYEQPHDIKLWCLGNEMDGQWQMGHKTAYEYGRVAYEAAKLMKWVDPSIELVVCGSCGRSLPTFGAWEYEVLKHTYDLVDYVSLHTYFGNHENNTANFLAKPDSMDAFIEEVVAMCDAVGAQLRRPRKLMLSFDEWNVWFHSASTPEQLGLPRWSEAPPILEDIYTFEDALVVGGMLISLMNHADRVKIGCIAQVVNVIAPIMTARGGAAWRQPTYWPLLHASQFGRGVVLRAVVDSPLYDCPEQQGTQTLKSTVMFDPETGAITLFALNRSLTEDLVVDIDLRSFEAMQPDFWTLLKHEDLLAVNTEAEPDKVTPTCGGTPVIDGAKVTVKLLPASWNVIRLKPAK